MKKILYAFFLTLAIAPFSCSDKEDASPSPDNGATIDGKTFSPTDNKATATGTGLSVSLKDGSKEIGLSLSDKTAGTYTITSSVPTGRTQATLSAIVSYYDGTDLYFGSSGTITVTVDASGKASGTFTITFKTAAGKTIELKDGKFTALTIAAAPAGKCLISTVSELNDNYKESFEYDGDGKLVKYSYDGGTNDYGQTNYFYAAGLMTNLQQVEFYNNKTKIRLEKRTYNSGKVTKIERSSNESGSMKPLESYDFEYNSAGQIIKTTWNRPSTSTAGSYKGVSVLEYDGNGNVVKSTYTFTESGSGSNSYVSTSVYSNYDTKPNFYQTVAQSLGSTNQVYEVYEQVGYDFSKNNPGKEVHTSSGSISTITYAYTYNSKGNVTKLTETDNYCYNDACDTDTYTTVIEYVGCN
jgi:hypothetical protein